jgi:hypothetical protein
LRYFAKWEVSLTVKNRVPLTMVNDTLEISRNGMFHIPPIMRLANTDILE